MRYGNFLPYTSLIGPRQSMSGYMRVSEACTNPL